MGRDIQSIANSRQNYFIGDAVSFISHNCITDAELVTAGSFHQKSVFSFVIGICGLSFGKHPVS